MPADTALRLPTVAYCGIGDEAALGITGQIEAVTALGWRSLELRTVDGTALADLPEADFEQVVGQLADAKLSVAAVDSRIGGWSRPVTGDFAEDLREWEVLARRCQVLGTRWIRVMSYPNAGLDEEAWGREAIRRISALAERAADAGLVLLHENCSGWAGDDASRALRLLEAAGEDGFGLLFDTGNGAAYGYSGYRMLTELLPHVRHVHLKDASGSGPRPVYRPPGAGELELARCLRLLLGQGYQGVLSIEPHLAVRPHEAYRAEPEACRAAFLDCGAALRSLLDDEVLPGTAGWRSTAAGLERA
ncbi:sugar phosphate isomerase/epimerase [Streptacidiphilus sp. P02-A3a]|uniref:sugar phosphate isomerase/epimerase family protein n=1 Tax=Streptacidiphilus sp. P02-A3a TaxID=2704468 RepID=UPI0015FC363A|nr:sugar phosphate isomerase/epimerase family protein [Streptacidiphilus sp. P02-A3a]QMU71330.1 sugar phosphate isomerase/epimerase [Streptacidiphilus sp. P02-A3a]